MKRNTEKKLSRNMLLVLAAGAMALTSIATPALAAKPGAPDRGSAAQRPRPDAAQVVLDNIASKLGRALTTSETKEIKAALGTAKTAIEEANSAWVEEIADVFGLTIEQVRAALQKRAPLVQSISELVGHQLTRAELDALRNATKARRDALKKIHDELVDTIASISGLTPEEADEALRPPPPPRPGDKPADKTGDKPECKPRGGEKGAAKVA